MARFYATFDNSTVSALASAYYNRLTFTNGATLQTNLLNARSALSAQVYANMATVDQDGTRGVVMPTDGYTRSGGNLTWTELYTNSAAVWPSDPATRPTATITVAGSTIISPSVADGSVTETYYTDAQTALQSALAGIAGSGPYARLGLNPWKTLASLHHDHAMTYFAWDDFTPGQVQTLTAPVTGDSSALTVTPEWASYQYLNDENTNARIKVTAYLASGGNNYSYDSTKITPPGTKNVTWNVGAVVAGTYQLDVNVWCYDASDNTIEGTVVSYTNPSVVVT